MQACPPCIENPGLPPLHHLNQISADETRNLLKISLLINMSEKS